MVFWAQKPTTEIANHFVLGCLPSKKICGRGSVVTYFLSVSPKQSEITHPKLFLRENNFCLRIRGFGYRGPPKGCMCYALSPPRCVSNTPRGAHPLYFPAKMTNKITKTHLEHHLEKCTGNKLGLGMICPPFKNTSKIESWETNRTNRSEPQKTSSFQVFPRYWHTKVKD
jgi:hypothetical protein